VFQVDGAQQLFLVCVSQCENDTQDDIVGRAVLNVSSYTHTFLTYGVKKIFCLRN